MRKKIEFLERKVRDLENHNAGLREVLLKNVQFSTKLSNITYEMDCLLVKKGREIRDLQEKLKNCRFKNYRQKRPSRQK